MRQGRSINLNAEKIPTGHGEEQPLSDYSIQDGDLEVVLRGHEHRLVKMINSAEYVFGCVAWLTSEPILKALAGCKGVGIIVQKEDWLRPDTDSPRGARWREMMLERYSRLRATDRLDHSFLRQLSTADIITGVQVDAVRCAGIRTDPRAPASPRCHHKFIVLAKRLEYGVRSEREWYTEELMTPYAVWTGSYNFTHNATLSFENAIITQRRGIVDAYYAEYQQIAALSEPLDWYSEYVSPEWRIGT